jgi:TPR repeat protein
MNPMAFKEDPSRPTGSSQERVKALFVAVSAALLFASVSPIAVEAQESRTSEKRFALVIGNSQYSSSPLKNPVNDARDIASTLRSFGFDVALHENTSYKDMRRAIIEFGNRLRDSGVGVFYYAGHGLQVNGRNYMVPVDAVIQGDAEVAVEAVDVDNILSRMETARNRLNIVILDACRDDPFTRSFRSPVQGLASIDAPIGTLIAYATAPGRVAQDASGEGANGLYTSELLKAIKIPGLRIEDVFKRVRQEVVKKTEGKQVPWEASSLTGDFSFTTVSAGVSTESRNDRASALRRDTTREERREPTAQESKAACEEVDRAKQYVSSADVASAIPLLREASRKGSAEGMWMLGALYASGFGVPRDQVEAVRLYVKSSEAGNSSAMRDLGFSYQNGWGVAKDQAEALRWFRKSADGGNADAMNDIGTAYLEGRGVAKDYAEALRWIRRSADAGNDVEALRWFRKAADAGQPVAMNEVGVAYNHGRGVAMDYAEALRWYRKSADAGNGLAMRNIGRMYHDGAGIVKNENEAVIWYRKGAEAGDAIAMNDLGVMYQHGIGVP